MFSRHRDSAGICSKVLLRFFLLPIQVKLVKISRFTSTTVAKFETVLYGFVLNILFHA